MPTEGQLAAYSLSVLQAEMSKACLVEVFIELGTPPTFLDVGCGPGHLVLYAAAVGCQAVGVDVCLPVREQVYTNSRTNGTARLIHADLLKEMKLEPASMVICWEVAEHLPPTAADPLVKLLAESTKECLFFTAAIPGQGGAGHLNEQPKNYWRDKFESYGLIYETSLTETLAQRMLIAAPAAPWYGNNLQIFRRES